MNARISKSLSTSTRSRTRLATVAALGTAALTLTACGNGDNDDPSANADITDTPAAGASAVNEAAQGTLGNHMLEKAPYAEAKLQDPSGAEVGTVTFTDASGGRTLVAVTTEGLAPGFHGFHIHEIGSCEKEADDAGDFTASGGHLGPEEDSVHPHHAGDLPSLLVNEDGTAEMTFVTDRLSPDMLLDEDGSAVVVHEQADNFAHIPERYAADGADEDTLSAGDGGSRVQCGVVSN